jgi:hypothetical protein
MTFDEYICREGIAVQLPQLTFEQHQALMTDAARECRVERVVITARVGGLPQIVQVVRPDGSTMVLLEPMGKLQEKSNPKIFFDRDNLAHFLSMDWITSAMRREPTGEAILSAYDKLGLVPPTAHLVSPSKEHVPFILEVDLI